MKENDELVKLKEWQDHQYNPGYWVNKFSPQFPHKRTIGFWILILIDVVLIIPAFIFSLIVYFIEVNEVYLIPIGILGVSSILVSLRAIRLKPEPKLEKSQVEIEELRRKRKKENKKLPNRRKDYQ